MQMKRLLFVLFCICFTYTLSAQNLVPTEVGMVLTYKDYDAKGKPVKVNKKDSWLTYTVKSNETKGDTTYVDLAIDMEYFYSKEYQEMKSKDVIIESIKTMTFKITKDSIFYDTTPLNSAISDMVGNMVKQAGAAASGMKSSIESKVSSFPIKMTAGAKLPDINSLTITYNMSMAGMNMSFGITTREENRIIEKQESITVPAGTFNCYKYSYDSMMSMTGMMAGKGDKEKVIEWWNPELGLIKSETYNDKGKLQTMRQLEETKK